MVGAGGMVGARDWARGGRIFVRFLTNGSPDAARGTAVPELGSGMNPGTLSRALTFPIPFGPLRGARWAPAAGGKVGRFFAGTYEEDQTEVFCRHVEPGQTVIDIGANVGYYTLLASRLVGASGTVVACEPEPLNASYLRRHVQANRLENVTILEIAVGREQGTVGFTRGKGRGRGHMAEDGELTVPVRTLDAVVAELALEPAHLKIDVEGAEADLLHGALETVRRFRPLIFLATHGRDVHEESCVLLRGEGYELSSIDGRPFDVTRKVLATP